MPPSRRFLYPNADLLFFSIYAAASSSRTRASASTHASSSSAVSSDRKCVVRVHLALPPPPPCLRADPLLAPDGLHEGPSLKLALPHLDRPSLSRPLLSPSLVPPYLTRSLLSRARRAVARRKETHLPGRSHAGGKKPAQRMVVVMPQPTTQRRYQTSASGRLGTHSFDQVEDDCALLGVPSLTAGALDAAAARGGDDAVGRKAACRGRLSPPIKPAAAQ